MERQGPLVRVSYPADYRQVNTKVEVGVNTNAQASDVKLVCDQAATKQLIEARNKLLAEGAKSLPQPDKPKLQAGTPIGATIVSEDPKITLMKSLEGCITYDQISCRADRIGRFGNTD